MDISKYVFIFLFLIPAFLFSRERGRYPHRKLPIGTIKGYVQDAETGDPLQYASVILFRQKDSLKVSGIASDSRGYFELDSISPGIYYIEVDFIGYKKRVFSSIKIEPRKPTVDIGTVKLEPSYIMEEPVQVKGEPAPLTYKIDKKVIDVKKMTTSLTGSAIDVLENVPSVTVDIEGNVKLRGSENITVLVDGRPVLLEPSEILQQIPASTIDKIEIITNPSAKYDPEGVSGIINIVLKKKFRLGLNGSLSSKLGIFGNYGASVLLAKRKKSVGGYINVNYDNRFLPGNLTTERLSIGENSSLKVNSDGDFHRYRRPTYVRWGVDVNMGERHLWNIGGTYSRWQMGGATELNYVEVSDTFPDPLEYLSTDTFKLGGPSLSGFLSYQRRFPDEDHNLSAEIYFTKRDRDIENWNVRKNTIGDIVSGEWTKKEGPSSLFRLKGSFAFPLENFGKIEVGYQGRWDFSEEESNLYVYQRDSMSYVVEPQFHVASRYKRDIQAIYGMFSKNLGILSFQLGLRLEYTHRGVEVVDSGIEYPINRIDYFPTLHLSYKLSNVGQIVSSYSRRIWRPRSWWLDPTVSWLDAYTVRRGNPTLEPEYIDSYELGLERPIGRGFLSFDGYYRETQNHIERITSTYRENVFLRTFENRGKSSSMGIELGFNVNPIRGLNSNLTLDLYKYQIDESVGSNSHQSNNWSVRLFNNFRLGNYRLQFNLNYMSPSVTSQGEKEGFFILNFAVMKTFFKGKMDVRLEARDFLRTAKFEYTSSGNAFQYHAIYKRDAPFLIFQVSYNFNNYRRIEKKLQKQEDTEEFELF